MTLTKGNGATDTESKKRPRKSAAKPRLSMNMCEMFKIVRSDEIEKHHVLNQLITKVENVDARDFDGYALLHYAAIEDKLDVAELLLRNGASPDVTVEDPWLDTDDEGTNNGCVPLHFARESVAKLLLGDNEDHRQTITKATVNKTNAVGLTPFDRYVYFNDVKMARFFLNRPERILAGELDCKAHFTTGTALAMKIAELETMGDKECRIASKFRALLSKFATRTTTGALIRDLQNYRKKIHRLDQKPEVYIILLELLEMSQF